MTIGITNFAVATVEEAIKLRKAGIKEKIILLSSTAIEEDIEKLIDNNITLTVGSKEAVEAVEKQAKQKNKKVKVHLKIDTGFGRYGFVYSSPEKIVQAIENVQNLEIEGTFTHFSMAFYEKSNYTEVQFQRFLKIIEVLKLNEIEPGILHVCNSSSFIRYPNMHLNAVRVGSAFVGKLSFRESLGLKKVGFLTSQVTEIKTLPKGFFVGYSNAYKTKKETKVAIIPCGYIDGFNLQIGKDMFRKVDKLRYIVRSIKDFFKKEALYVTIAGEKCKVISRVGTFHITADITGKNIKVGDIAQLDVKPTLVNPDIRREYV